MKLAIHTTIKSPHLMPLARELSRRMGDDQFRYVYTVSHDNSREKMGWENDDAEWCEYANDGYGSALEADYLLTSFRDCALIQQRIQKHKHTFYLSERWLKPPVGLLRLCIPRYYHIAKLFCRYLQSPDFNYMAIGIHAARDMVRIYELLMENNASRLFNAPIIAFESRPGGAILPIDAAFEQGLVTRKEKLYAQDNGFCQIPQEKWGNAKPQGVYAKIKMWGYFVEPSQKQQDIHSRNSVLWVGRLLKWKRVDTLIRACNGLNLHLDIYGDGPEKAKLKNIASPCVHFHPFVPITEIRNIMREHKIYAFPSNGYEGWGAVVSEALEEWMVVYASYESGAGATMLPCNRLFHANDYEALAMLLSQDNSHGAIGTWSAKYAAGYFANLLKNK